MTYNIDLGYVSFCIDVENDIIINAPGVAKWTLNKPWEEVKTYYVTYKNAKIKKLRE